jgi:Fatty acid desaturase
VWTSEEDQHATLLETYLLLSGNGDPAARARARKAVIAAGWNHQLGGPFEGMVYTAIQEAVTRTFYLCTARACDQEDPRLAEALRRIAKDETLHMAFYRDVVKAHLDLDPGYLRPLAAVMTRFQMPWSASFAGDFAERQSYVAAHRVFTLADYYHDVVQFVLGDQSPRAAAWRGAQGADPAPKVPRPCERLRAAASQDSTARLTPSALRRPCRPSGRSLTRGSSLPARGGCFIARAGSPAPPSQFKRMGGTAFAWWDTWLVVPLCLLLALGCLVAALSEH